MTRPVSFHKFCVLLLAQLELPLPQDISPASGLFDDLAIDSIQAFEMLLVIEQAADLLLPPPEIPHIFTIGDAYGYYLAACALAADQW